jgi:uncharacterized protein YbbK (DUF523 family)
VTGRRRSPGDGERVRPNRPRLGISACLLGDRVRFDGGHKRDSLLADVLAGEVEWVRVCPEVELGMGTPRETLQLVRLRDGVRMMTTRTSVDHTGAMQAWARGRIAALAAENLSGYVFKTRSPSCGMQGVTIYDPAGTPAGDGRGLFAEALIGAFPDLPVEDDERLRDPGVRQDFIRRVFDYWDYWRARGRP